MSRQAVNPFLPSWEYVPDGEPYVFDGRLYVFGSHDRFNGTIFCMNDYVCWSTDVNNLADWRFEGTIYRKTQDPMAKEDSIMQAPDVCRGPDGRYYLYYTLGLVPVMSVAVCDTPAGQYEFYGVVCYEDGTQVGLKEHDLFQFDPGVFRDDDGKIWLYSGFGANVCKEFAAAQKKYKLDGAYVMELQEDMLTICGKPKKILSSNGEHGFFEASSMRKINGKYYFVYSSVLSHELCYAVSDRPDSGFEYGGILVSIGDLGLEGNQTPVNYLGNTHGSLVCISGKWYIFYHRQTNRQQFSRQACAEQIELDEYGHFRQAEVTSCGLNDGPLLGQGTYEARIACNLQAREGALTYGRDCTPEAVNHPYFTQSGSDREGQGDQYIANMQDGAAAGYKYFSCNGTAGIKIEVSGNGKGTVEVSAEREALPFCRIEVALQGEKRWYKKTFEPLYGKMALYFSYRGTGSINFHTFVLEESNED